MTTYSVTIQDLRPGGELRRFTREFNSAIRRGAIEQATLRLRLLDNMTEGVDRKAQEVARRSGAVASALAYIVREGRMRERNYRPNSGEEREVQKKYVKSHPNIYQAPRQSATQPSPASRHLTTAPARATLSEDQGAPHCPAHGEMTTTPTQE
jgi:hypothetical protein